MSNQKPTFDIAKQYIGYHYQIENETHILKYKKMIVSKKVWKKIKILFT